MTRFSLLVVLALVLLLGGCIPDGLTDYDFRALQPPQPERPGPPVFERVGEAEAGALRVVLYAEGGWRAGYRPLRIGVTEGERAVTAARVTLAAEVARGEGLVAAPVELPASTEADGEGYFRAAAFLLPERAETPVRLRVAVEAGARPPVEALFEGTLRPDPFWVRRGGDVPYHGVWVRPRKPVVGDNRFEAMLWRETADGFAPLTGVGVELFPWMDMGGGDGHSTPFTPAREVEPGRWASRISFNMSGGWELSLYVRRPGLPTDTVRFAPFTVFDP